MTHRLQRQLVPMLVLALVAGLGLTGVPADAQDEGWIDVNFNDWHVEGGPSDWRIEDGGAQARQVTNGEFTTMVSGVDNLVDVEMRGRIRVDTSSDNDLVGLVAGHRRPVAASGDPWQETETVIFGWKEQAQGGAPEGMKLASINGTVITTTPTSFNNIWFSDPPRAGTTVLDRDTGAGTGWRAGTWYDVRMVYRHDLVEVYVDGDLRLSATGTFLPGRLGVYDQSQASAVYRDFQYRHLTSPPTADAGEDVSFDLARSAVLDGSGSSDPDGDVLSYSWAIVASDGGPFALVDAQTANPIVTAEGPGSATVELTVSDGTGSDTDTVEVNATGSLQPTADAGDDQSVAEGSTVTLDGSGSSVTGFDTRTWTTTAEFEEGSSVNLDTAGDRLRLDDEQAAFDFIWIAASGRGTVVKVDTLTGEVLGEYWSAPQNRAKNPSRTTVDKQGNVWVGNRDESSSVGGTSKGSVAKIGLVENGQCVDRNGNGIIDTSSGLGDILGWPNADGTDTPGGVTSAVDECIIEYVRTSGRNIRQVSVDADNHVWVGGDGTGGTPRFFDRLTPAGEIVRSINMASGADTGAGSVPCCYGGLIDPDGVLWSASGSSNRLVRIDPDRPNGDPALLKSINVGRTAYGMGLDPAGNVWLSNWTANTIQKFDPTGTLLGTFPTGGPGGDRGVAVTDDGDVWVANSNGSSVSRLDNDGAFRAEVGVGSQPTGIAVDAGGYVWASNRSSNSASRIDPATNAVDLTVDLGPGAAPYNYSDMTGSTLSGAPDSGTWTLHHDSGADDTAWSFVEAAADVPGDASVSITVATSSDGITFGPDTVVETDGRLDGVVGRHLRVRVQLTRSSSGDSPVVHDVTVGRPGGAGTPNFQWTLLDADGPPVFLTRANTATPSFVAPDDADYTFEVTVTDGAGRSDTDRVRVTVDNADPTLEVDSGRSVAGGVTVVSGSFLDQGWLDTHTASIDWGDGTGEAAQVAPQGSGWGAVFGSHVYDEAGTYTVEVALVDDDGGTVAASVTELGVSEPVALWADSTTAGNALDWAGGVGTVHGLVHSNDDINIVGRLKTFDTVEYVGSLKVGGQTQMPADTAVVEPRDHPLDHELADFAPDGPVAAAVGDAYHDDSSSCAGGTWHVVNEVLEPGVHFVDCDVQLNGSTLGGAVTLVATGTITVSGSRPVFEPYWDGLLFLSGSSADGAIDLNSQGSKLLGTIFAPDGEVQLSSSDNRFHCAVVGDRVTITGSDLFLTGADCSTPDDTSVGPLFVPDVSVEVDGPTGEVAPGQDLSSTVTVSHDGGQLVVPGLVGFENVDEVTATVAGFDLLVERQSASTGTWEPIASSGDGTVDLTLQPNPRPGTTFAADGPTGTTVEPGAWATWGAQAIVALDAAAVADLLDEAVTSGLRTRVLVDLQPDGVQARRLYTYGTDLLPAIRAQGGDVGAPVVTLLSPVDGPILLDADDEPALASLAPGDVVTIDRSSAAPTPAPRSADEDDAGYLARLQALDGSSLVTAAFATGTGAVGQLVAPVDLATATVHLPIVSSSAAGPQTVTTGDPATYDFTIANVGSRPATGVDYDATAGAEILTLDPPVPSDLVTGQRLDTAATWSTPSSPRSAAVRGAATWSDAAGNTYGPLGDTVPVAVRSPGAVAAILQDTLAIDDNGDGRVSPGDTVRYDLQVTNTGGTPLDDVAATVPIPDGATLVPGSTSTTVPQAAPDEAATEVTASFGTVGPGTTVALTFSVVVEDPFPAGLTGLTAIATITAAGIDPVASDDPDRLGSANPTTTVVVVPAPVVVAYLTGELAIDADTSMTLSGGDTIRYELEVASLGSQVVTDAVATVPIPAGTTLVAGSPATDTGTVSTIADTVVVDLGDLAPDARATLTFAVTVDIPETVQQVTAQATVTATNHDDVASDDPATFSPFGDATVLVVHGAPGGGGGGGDPEEPGATIEPLSLADGTVVTVPVDLSTTLTPPDGETVSWVVTARPSGDGTAVELAAGDGADVAATFDPTAIANGSWVVEVTATTSAGAISMAQAHVTVDTDFKPGRVVSTYLDLDIGVAGLPVQVRRTYDSFDSSVGDFGVGWSLDVVDFQVATNGPLGQGGWVMDGCGTGLIILPLCYTTESPHFVTVTWPDGRTETFDLTPAQGSTFFPGLTSAQFTGRPGTTSKLAAVDTSLFFSNGNLLGGSFGNGGIYNPRKFRLTDQFGTEYLLEVGVGLTRMRDRVGNTVTVDEDGITSSFGPSVTFTRDGQGRIEFVDGPGDQDLTYEYDAAGDLVAVTDPNGDDTTYEYVDHRMVAEYGPEGTTPLAQLFYFPDGRLQRIVDADGVRTEFRSEVGDRTETVVSNDGRLVTTSTYDADGHRIRLDETFGGVTYPTEFTYDEWDNVETRTDPDGNVWEATWDGRTITDFAAPGREPLEISYNDFGQPETWTDQDDNPTTYVWNPDGTLREIVDADGHAETYTYYPDGTRKTRTDREDNTWTWTYHDDGLVATETDPRGHVTSFDYDDAGRLVERVDPVLASAGETDPGRSTWTYDDVGNLRLHTDQEGHTTEWVYDGLNRMIERLDPAPEGESYRTTWTWTDAGRVETETDPEGVTTTWTYGSNGQADTMQVAELAPTVYGYDGAGRLASETDPVDRETTYTYDRAGRLDTATNPADGTTTYDYWPDGKVHTVTDPAGGVTTTTYTDRGMVASVTTKVTETLDRVTTYGYDDVGRLERVTQPDLTEIVHTYDKAGRVDATTDPATGTTTFDYDAAGNRTVVTDATGVAVRSTYDELNRLHTTLDAYDNTTRYDYDLASRLEEVTTPEGVVTSYGHDPRGLQTSRADTLGNTWHTVHDDAGRIELEVDARGAETRYGYDAAGRLATITDHADNQVTFGYDDAGQRTSLTDPRGKTWTYDYAETGGLELEVDPLGNPQRWEFDDAGRLDASIDGRGVRQDYTLDLAGQTTAIDHPDGQVTFDHDIMGRRDRMVDETGETTWGYQPDTGRLATVTSPAGTVAYGYDDAGRRTSMTTPAGPVTYGHDLAGRLDSITDFNDDTIGLGLDGDGRRRSLTHPNGTTSTWEFDDAGRLDEIVHRAADDSVIDSFAYTHDANGNRRTMTSPAGTETYTLNALNQLTGVDYSDRPDVTYTYDPAGNRATQTVTGDGTTTYTYDDASRLTAAGATTFGHDDAGNLTAAGADTYTYDWDGRMDSATVDGATTNYTHDADGLRVQADGTGLLYDRTADGPVPALLSDGDTTWLGAGGDPVSAIGTGDAGGIHTDALGSIRATTDPTGALSGTASYDAFGAQTGNVGPLGFTGGQQDRSGQVWLHARTYLPDLGRFTAVDPVRPGGPGVAGHNPYTYVTNNPTTSVDPSGTFQQSPRGGGTEYGILLAGIAARTAPQAAAVGQSLRWVYWALATSLVAGGACALACPRPQPQPDPDTDTRRPRPDNPPRPDPLPQPDPQPDPEPPTTDDDDRQRCQADPDYLKARAQILWSQWTATQDGRRDLIAERNNTVAVLRVAYPDSPTCIDVVGGGSANDLPRQSRKVSYLAHEVVAQAPDVHAEGTVMSQQPVLVPGALRLAIATSRDFCDYESAGAGQQCRAMIDAAGARIVDAKSAIWRQTS